MDMEQWARVRRKVLVDGESKRSVMSAEGLHWETLQKMLSHSRPPGYRLVTPRGRESRLGGVCLSYNVCARDALCCVFCHQCALSGCQRLIGVPAW